MIGNILGNVYGITLYIYVVTYLGSLDGSLDGFNDDKLEGLLIEGSLGYNHGKVIGSDEAIKLGISDGKVFVTILGDAHGTTLGIDVGTYTSSLDGSVDGSNDGKLEGLLIGGSLGSKDVEMIDSDEVIKMGSTDSKVIGTIIVNVDGITIGIDVGT